MPLTDKGEEIKSAMTKEYGPEKGERVFYASKNKGTITGVDDQPEELIPADNAATCAGPPAAEDEKYPQEDLPSQQHPNTVDNDSPAASSISPNTAWPGRHL